MKFYWVCYLLICRCSEAYNVGKWNLEQIMYTSLERLSKSDQLQIFFSCWGQMCSWQKACFSVGAHEFQLQEPTCFITIYVSPAKIWHHKVPRAILLSVRIKSPIDCGGHGMKPQVKLFQGAETTSSYSYILFFPWQEYSSQMINHWNMDSHLHHKTLSPEDGSNYFIAPFAFSVYEILNASIH